MAIEGPSTRDLFATKSIGAAARKDAGESKLNKCRRTRWT